MVVEGLAVVERGVLAAGVAVMDERDVGAPGTRRVSAIRKASRTRSVRMCAANCQPTIARLYASITNAK